jgi:putative restriction endonuclease
MTEGQKLWTRDELILANNLYCKIPFGKMHRGNRQVIELSNLIGRTPGAVARKLGNFASFDPTLKARGIKGLTNAGKLDGQIWNEFYNNWDEAIIQSEMFLASTERTTIEVLNDVSIENLPKGESKERVVETRVNQNIFRKIVLATYNNKCCITGISNTELLVASHIVPWSKDENNRLNPMNGLCLNALHDKAFDRGLITISSEDYSIVISSKLKPKKEEPNIREYFLKYEGAKINLPDKFLPSREFLKIHNDIFKS